jgi:hypothetical protein
LIKAGPRMDGRPGLVNKIIVRPWSDGSVRRSSVCESSSSLENERKIEDDDENEHESPN